MRISALILILTCLTPLSAMAGRCDGLIGDGVCDCGCLSTDSDCTSGEFSVCVRGHCPSGQVPWEHSNSQCMTSACGDGWKDEAAGEACDDGNALASGGCSADCHTVTTGYVCGAVASGCHLAPPDAGSPGVDAGTIDAGQSGTPDAGGAVDAGARMDAGAADAGTLDTQKPSGGCSAVPQADLLSGIALAWLLARARGSRQ